MLRGTGPRSLNPNLGPLPLPRTHIYRNTGLFSLWRLQKRSVPPKSQPEHYSIERFDSNSAEDRLLGVKSRQHSLCH